MGKLDIDELDELEDSEDEAILIEYRKKRIAELKELASRSRFGYVREITGEEYVNEVRLKFNPAASSSYYSKFIFRSTKPERRFGSSCICTLKVFRSVRS